jgi:hypothetical protein
MSPANRVSIRSRVILSGVRSTRDNSSLSADTKPEVHLKIFPRKKTTFKTVFAYRHDRHLSMKKVVKLTQIMGFLSEKFAPTPAPEVGFVQYTVESVALGSRIILK